jgi:hypothetical protein
MGNIKKEYIFKGLDTRTSELYRVDGTASDCRNVRLDSNRRLAKVNDMAVTIIPRAVSDLAGPFETNLPLSATIIGLMPFDDYFVLATSIKAEFIPGVYKYVNKFYKWDQVANTVEFIPFEKETQHDINGVSSNLNQIVYKAPSEIAGDITYLNQEGVLYFIGNKYPEHTDFEPTTPNLEDELYNRSPILTYDGKVIGTSGCPSSLVDTTSDLGIQNTNEYVRILPMKIDALGRHTFGNYTTHLGTNVDPIGAGTRVIRYTATPVDNIADYCAFVRLTASGGNLNLSAAGNTAARTVAVQFYERSGIWKSAAKGQILYGISYNFVQLGVGFPATDLSIVEQYSFYRCTIEDVDYIGDTVTLTDFRKYSDDTGLWASSANFVHTGDSESVECGDRPHFLSNIIQNVYGSSDFTFGYTLKAFVMLPYGLTGYEFSYPTSKLYSYPLPLQPGSPELQMDNVFLYISEDLDDIIDTSTVKLPAPKVRHLTNYLGAIICVDEKNLYFSDFSTGGNIETFTPFDSFAFGSTKRGLVTGVFANETYIVGFREEEAYYITGNIFVSNYRIQSYKSTRIGCSDPRSISDFQGAGIFASEKGIFLALQGGAMQEASDAIETMFTEDSLGLELDQFDVKTVIDFRREYVYFAIASKSDDQDHYILAYSYYHKEWFLYDNISAAGAFDLFDGKIHSSDGLNVYIEEDTQLEAEAYYRSNFETLGMASFPKKFHQVLVYTMDVTEANAIGIKTYKNWDKDTAITDQSKSVSPGDIVMIQRFDPTRSNSAAIELKSGAGQQFLVNGYEYEFEADVEMFKNDSNS